jgi:hypothetical protein
MPTYTLMVMANVVPGLEDDFEDWYDNRHFPDLLSLDGIVAARRFRVLGSEPASDRPPTHGFVTFYEVETDDLDALKATFAELAAERAEALAAGREPRVAFTPAIAPDIVSWWLEPATEQRRAPS